MTDVVILAGGKGTRLSGVIGDVPKCLAMIGPNPFIEYQLAYLMSQGLYNIILSVSHLKEQIFNHFEGYWRTCGILFSIEDEPLGTGGAVKQALKYCTSEMVLVMNGDTLFTIDTSIIYKRQMQTNADAVIALRKVPDCGRYGKVTIDDHGWVKDFNEKVPDSGEGYINGGIYLFKRKVFDRVELPEAFSLEEYFLPQSCKLFRYQGIPFNDYFLDIGVPGDFERAQKEFGVIGKNYGLFR